ncbi:MAG: ATP-binding protein [Methanomicrobiales archaeon]
METEDNNTGYDPGHNPVGRDFIASSLLTYRFLECAGAGLFIGDIVRIRDLGTSVTFFAKVTGLCHTTHESCPGMTDCSPGTGFGVLVDAFPLGFVDETGKFQPPGFIPASGSLVSRPVAADLSFIRASMGDIEVGALKSGRGIVKDIPVAIPSEAVPQHIGIFGTTGTGKSNLMKVFAASCMDIRKLGLLIVDPHGEYVLGQGTPGGILGLLNYVGGREGLAVYSTRPAEERLRYGMEELTIEHNDFRMTDLGLIFNLSDPMWEIIESLDPFSGDEIIDFFVSEGVESLPSPHRITSQESRYPHIVYALRGASSGNLKAIQSRMSLLVSETSLFLRRNGSSVPGIIRDLMDNKVVLVDAPLMGESTELLLLSAITRAIMKVYQESAMSAIMSPEKKEHKVLIAIEEAQRILSSGGHKTHIFRECAIEGRKFGVGLCIITQHPKNIDPRILAQINTYIVLGLSDRNDRAMIASSAKQDLSWMDTEIQTLMRGDAVISTSAIVFPLSTRVHRFENYILYLEKKRKDPGPGN